MSNPYIVTFRDAGKVKGNTLSIFIRFTVNAEGIARTIYLDSTNIKITDWGTITHKYDLDDNLLIPGVYTVTIGDPDKEMLAFFLGTTEEGLAAETEAEVFVIYNSGEEIRGRIRDDSISGDDSTLSFSIEIRSQIDILNKTMVKDKSGNAKNPLGYNLSRFWPFIKLKTMIQDIYKFVVSVMQDANDTGIHAAIAILSTAQDISTGFTNPDYVAKKITARGDHSFVSVDVTIFGTNINGISYSETLHLSGFTLQTTTEKFLTITQVRVFGQTITGGVLHVLIGYAEYLLPSVPQYFEFKHDYYNYWASYAIDGTGPFITDGTFDELYVDYTKFFSPPFAWGTTLGEIVRNIAKVFFCMTGMTSNQNIIFNKLFYFAEDNVQDLGKPISHKPGLKYHRVSYVFFKDGDSIGGELPDTDAYTNNEGDFIQVDSFPTEYKIIRDDHIYHAGKAYDPKFPETLMPFHQLSTENWYYYRGNKMYCRSDEFIFPTCNVDFTKNFIDEGIRFQILERQKFLSLNKTKVTGVFVGTGDVDIPEEEE